METVFRRGVLFLAGCLFLMPGFLTAQTSIKSDDKINHILNPFLLRYEGFGNFMGAAYLGKNAFFKKGDVFAIQSVIDSPVTVVGVRNFTIPLFYSSLYTAFFYSKGTYLPYTLTRGMQSNRPYRFDSDMEGWVFGITGSISQSRILTGNFSFATISEKVSGVTNSDFKLIFSPSTNISFLNGNIYSTRLQLNLTDDENYPRSGIIGGFNYTVIDPTNLYSEFRTTDIYASFYIPIKNFTITGHTYLSTSSVAKKRGGATSELRNKFSGECNNTKSDFSGQNKSEVCSVFVEKYMTYLTSLNKYGLSSPLGGPNMLRSEDFLQYQGSKTYYQGFELRYNDSAIRNGTIEFALFTEIGQTYDEDTASEYKTALNANGIGLRLIDPLIVYRLDYASSKNGNGVYLTVNHPW